MLHQNTEAHSRTEALLRFPSRILLLAALLGTLAGTVLADDLLGPPPAEALADVDPELRDEILRLEKRTPYDGTNYRNQFDLANLYYDAGLFDRSEKRYLRSLELNPKFVGALVNLGALYEDQSKVADAIARYEEALALDPEDCRARSNLGNAYYGESRFPDAMYEYERAIELDRDCFQAYFNKAVAFADAGIFREAVRYWGEVVRIAPGTEAARQAKENIGLLKQFTSGPLPAPRTVPDH
jgi:tetratricopeptide (TPR) repeat protein